MDPLQTALLQTSPWLTSLSDCGDNQWSCSALFAHIQLGTFLPGSSPLLCPPLFGFGTNAGGRGNNIERSHYFCSHHSSPGRGGFPCTSEEGQGFKCSSWTMKWGVLTGLPGRQGNHLSKTADHLSLPDDLPELLLFPFTLYSRSVLVFSAQDKTTCYCCWYDVILWRLKITLNQKVKATL